MSLLNEALSEQQKEMTFVPFHGPAGINLVTLSLLSFVVLKGTSGQLLNLL
jgi:hypothetical protein